MTMLPVVEPQRRHHVADTRSVVLVLILDFGDLNSSVERRCGDW